MEKMRKFFVTMMVCIFIAIILIYIFFKVYLHRNSDISYSFIEADVGLVKAYDLFVETSAQLQINFDPDSKEEDVCYFLLDFEDESSFEVTDDNGEYFNIVEKSNISKSLYLIKFKPANQNKKSIIMSKGTCHRIVSTGTDVNNTDIDTMDPFEYDFVFNKNGFIDNAFSFYKDFCVYIMNRDYDHDTYFELNDFIIYRIYIKDEDENINDYLENGKECSMEEIFDSTDLKRTIILKSYYKILYRMDSLFKTKDGAVIKNNVPIQIYFAQEKEDISDIEIRSIESFEALHSSGSLSCYPTATEVLYPINAQEVKLYPVNKVTSESKLNINNTNIDDSLNVTGTISIPKGKGTIAGKQISPSFMEWLYENYNTIFLNIITTIFSCSITFCVKQMPNRTDEKDSKIVGERKKGDKKRSKNKRKVRWKT